MIDKHLFFLITSISILPPSTKEIGFKKKLVTLT